LKYIQTVKDTGNNTKMMKKYRHYTKPGLPTVTFSFECALIFVTEITTLFDSLFSY